MSATPSVHSEDNLSDDEHKHSSIEKEVRKLIEKNQKSLRYLKIKEHDKVSAMELWARAGLEECNTDLRNIGSDYGTPEPGTKAARELSQMCVFHH